MNIHHLELFYYVARFGGISEAVRNIPYGIQQPAISAQLLQLEDSLGVTLFHRRPFSLTAPGEALYKFVQPFFENVETVAQQIRGGVEQQIRIGASEIVLRDHLPEILHELRSKFPKLKLVLREGYQPELERLLQQQEIDVAVTLLERKPPTGIRSCLLLELPLILLVNKKSRIKSAADLWAKDKIDETLLCLPTTEAICKNFQQGLAKLNVAWFPGIELSSLQLIEKYVQEGYGIGLGVKVPGAVISNAVNMIPLDEFAPVQFGVLWRGKPTTLVQGFIDALQKRAAHFQAA